MRTERALAFLAGVDVFGSCGPDLLAQVAAAVEQRFVPAGEYLFRQGDRADALLVVVSGRLEILFEDPTPVRMAGLAGAGAVLGELALLTETTRAASVRAIRDSVLYELRRAEFLDLLAVHPHLGVAIARNLSGRLRASAPVNVPKERPSVFAVAALQPDLPARQLAQDLRDTLAATRPALLLDEQAAGGDEQAFGALLDQADAVGDVVVLLAAGGDEATAWRRFCLRSADRRVLLVSGRSPVTRGDVGGQGDIVFLGPVPSSAALSRTLDALRPRAHHFVRAEPQRGHDIARLARRLAGDAWGVVLSGGGARGLAHIGALERLLEAGIEIDRVGGCSMGAFVGSMLAMGWPPTRMTAVCREELLRRHPFNDYHVPRVSLIGGRKAAAMLRRVLGDRLVEELDRPFFSVSADLVSGEVVAYRRGPLWQTVGASMALPGLVPPLALDGRLLVDGGVLDNLPVDVMAESGEGPVIAVDVMRRREPPRPGLPATPRILETISRAMVLASGQRADLNRRRADVLITPDVADIGLLDFSRLDDAVAAGRSAADAVLERMHSSPIRE